MMRLASIIDKCFTAELILRRVSLSSASQIHKNLQIHLWSCMSEEHTEPLNQKKKSKKCGTRRDGNTCKAFFLVLEINRTRENTEINKY
jgi:hypothetical protein